MNATDTSTRARRSRARISNLERAALDDAARLAELWDVALRASFQLGYDTGHQRGVIAGRNEEATAWQAIVTGYSAVLDTPTRAERRARADAAPVAAASAPPP